MVDSFPSSIELSPVQREILDLIIQDQASIQGPVQPERAILLWGDGVSESATAQKLGISEESVRILRYHASQLANLIQRSVKGSWSID
jgi:hypothetical protein